MEKKKPFKLFVDTETTGFPEQAGWIGNDVLTWSGIITDSDLNILDKKTIFSKPNPKTPWNDEAEKFHGINYYQAMQFPSKKQAIIDIMNFIKDYKGKIEWIEHSLNWIDWLFTFGLFYEFNLEAKFRLAFNSDFRFSTIRIARENGFKKNRLNEWADRLNIKLKHHDSESDAMACYEVYKYLNKEYKQEQEGLFAFIGE